jgi:hypothetical protein
MDVLEILLVKASHDANCASFPLGDDQSSLRDTRALEKVRAELYDTTEAAKQGIDLLCLLKRLCTN